MVSIDDWAYSRRKVFIEEDEPPGPETAVYYAPKVYEYENAYKEYKVATCMAFKDDTLKALKDDKKFK